MRRPVYAPQTRVKEALHLGCRIPHKKSLATEVIRPFIELLFYWQNRTEE